MKRETCIHVCRHPVVGTCLYLLLQCLLNSNCINLHYSEYINVNNKECEEGEVYTEVCESLCLLLQCLLLTND